MSTDPLWSAICDLDPAAELRYEPPGGWAVRLRSIYYQYNALAAPFLVTARKAPSREQAIERMWSRLMSLSDAATLYRDFAQHPQLVRWEGEQWVPVE